MSVKSKVKRCNKEIKRLDKKIEILELELERKNNNLKRISEDYEKDSEKLKLYENIIKFAIDKMKGLKLSIECEPMLHAYIMRVTYY